MFPITAKEIINIFGIGKAKKMNTIIRWGDTSAAIENICYTLILRKDEIVLWTNGNRFTIDKDNVRNVWASNVIFLEDTNDKIYIIGYNHNNRLGTRGTRRRISLL